MKPGFNEHDQRRHVTAVAFWTLLEADDELRARCQDRTEWQSVYHTWKAGRADAVGGAADVRAKTFGSTPPASPQSPFLASPTRCPVHPLVASVS